MIQRIKKDDYLFIDPEFSENDREFLGIGVAFIGHRTSLQTRYPHQDGTH